MSTLAVYDCMMWFMQAARPHRVHETFALLDSGAAELCVSRAVLEEIHDVLTRPRHLAKFPALTPDRVSRFIREYSMRARFIDPIPESYIVERDPKDSKYINLALAAGAPFLVTRDHDLLELMDRSTDAGAEFAMRFPHLQIVEPAAFVQTICKSK